MIKVGTPVVVRCAATYISHDEHFTCLCVLLTSQLLFPTGNAIANKKNILKGTMFVHPSMHCWAAWFQIDVCPDGVSFKQTHALPIIETKA